MSRRCTDEGWTDLEPSPYPVACVTEPYLEEVGLSAPHPHQSSYPTHPTPTPAPSTLSHRLAGEGCGLCGSQDSWALPSPGAPSLARPAFPGACPLASPDEGAFMRMTQSSKS